MPGQQVATVAGHQLSEPSQREVVTNEMGHPVLKPNRNACRENHKCNVTTNSRAKFQARHTHCTKAGTLESSDLILRYNNTTSTTDALSFMTMLNQL